VSGYQWLLMLHVTGASFLLGGSVVAALLNILALRTNRPSEIALLLAPSAGRSRRPISRAACRCLAGNERKVGLSLKMSAYKLLTAREGFPRKRRIGSLQ
jgi:hypothetical protein